MGKVMPEASATPLLRRIFKIAKLQLLMRICNLVKKNLTRLIKLETDLMMILIIMNLLRKVASRSIFHQLRLKTILISFGKKKGICLILCMENLNLLKRMGQWRYNRLVHKCFS